VNGIVNGPANGLGQAIGTDGGRSHPLVAYRQVDLSSLKSYMLTLMMRNITSNGFVFEDPQKPGTYSSPGSVLAAPSYPANTPGVDQDYVFNWVRDSAITMIEIAEARLPAINGGVEALCDYVTFASLCFANATPSKGHACFTVEGDSRCWTEQNDGPALQSITLLRAFDQLDQPSQQAAIALINANVAYLLDDDEYQKPTVNLWEEHQGLSFFAYSAQLKCFRAIAANTIGAAVPGGIEPAIAWLETEIAAHWNGSYYVSLATPGSNPLQSVVPGYDANIDIIQASIYGAVPCTDPKLLATAAILHQQWSDPASPTVYPINIADQARGIGPLFGRYPSDIYDGDVSHPVDGGHPWALSTANFAELLYTLATTIGASKKVSLDPLSTPFFAGFGIGATTKPADAVAALRSAGDAMLRAVLFHSDRYELSEQFDAQSGYEKSVRNLTWSYAAFLSALRARDAQAA